MSSPSISFHFIFKLNGVRSVEGLNLGSTNIKCYSKIGVNVSDLESYALISIQVPLVMALGKLLTFFKPQLPDISLC